MESYLGDQLAFLDPAQQLHPTADPAGSLSAQQLAAPFDYDCWFNPHPAAAYDTQSILSGAQASGAADPALLDGRAGLAPAAASHPFGVLSADAAPAVRSTPGSISSLVSTMGTSVGPGGTLHLSYGAPDFGTDFLAAAASGTAPRGSPTQSVYTPSAAASLASSMSSSMSATDPSTFSIAAYGSGTSSRRTSAAPTPVQQSPRHNTRSSGKVLQPSASGPAVATRGGNGKAPKTPQADESVPEAALHLLRLAGNADGSTGSVATNSTGRGDEGSGDEDAEGESDDTSIHSTDLLALKPVGKLFFDPQGGAAQPGQLETRVWNHNPNEPPLHVQRGGGPASRRPSVTSSVATSVRTRQHIPARTQREASTASSRSRAASEAPSAASRQEPLAPPPAPSSSQQFSPATNRRTSGRVRKPVIQSHVAADLDSDGSDSEGDYGAEDAYADGDGDSDGGKGKGKKKKGSKVSPSKAKGKGKAKRPSTGGSSAPTKKARTSKAAVDTTPIPPRKPRRQAYIPPNLQNRTFPPHIPISADFPRFYRAFPVSSAISPESYVLKQPNGQPRPLHGLGPSLPVHQLQHFPSHPHHHQQQQLDHMLPTPPMPLYEQFPFAPYQQSLNSPIATTPLSTSTSGPNFFIDAHGNVTLTHLPTPPQPSPVQHPHAHQHPHAAHASQAHAALAALSASAPGVPHQHLHAAAAMSPPHTLAASTSSSGSSTPLGSSAASVLGASTSSTAATSVAADPLSGSTSSSQASTSAAAAGAAPSGPLPTIPGPNGINLMQPPADAKWNKASDPLNLYWPRFVRGNADDKCGMCPVCAEPRERGGEGEQKWLKLKNSSYVYHMSYAHGLSNTTGLPFSPPVELRVVPTGNKNKDTRPEMTEGKCHKCHVWVPLLSIKNVEAIVPELIWWKHAKKCHGESTIPGEDDVFVRDEVYQLVVQRKAEHGATAAASQAARQAVGMR
ncbi:hypothetical protein JCM8097_000751 [Rhodosporidiobolus ruineniae]